MRCYKRREKSGAKECRWAISHNVGRRAKYGYTSTEHLVRGAGNAGGRINGPYYKVPLSAVFTRDRD